MAAHFAARRPGKVTRYELPRLLAFNFVIDDVLEGGVNVSLGLDGHGKALSFFLLGIVITVDAELPAQGAATCPEARARKRNRRITP